MKIRFPTASRGLPVSSHPHKESRLHPAGSNRRQCAGIPGGFPQGCSGAYSEFKHRIKKGRPPLPELSSCTTGPNGEKVSGHYQLGYERYEPCEDGYVLRESQQYNQAKCYVERCAPERYSNDNYYCDSYQAVLRPKPNYVKMWVNGDYLGQYFY